MTIADFLKRVADFQDKGGTLGDLVRAMEMWERGWTDGWEARALYEMQIEAGKREVR